MQIVISPAKLMNFEGNIPSMGTSYPLFPEKTATLVEICRQLSEREIIAKMKVNTTIAHHVYEYFQTFDFESTPRRAAALAYNGIAYKGLNAVDFSKEDYDFAQQHLNILSALYGMLRPFDEIKPYRLEMHRKIVPAGCKSLYDYWEDSLNDYLSRKLDKDDKIVIDVSSSEYGKILNPKILPRRTRIISMNFLQHQGNNFKQIVVHTKKARGMLSRFIIKNKIYRLEDVKAFDSEGYFFYQKLSSSNEWFFVR
ncbi:YaaA family protein [Seramator thermalis]|jgi:hypothetical protein|uniref:YaaA family protein n=1 Tax=Seramator thermalis TaxID=2496270 RepID=UPI00101B70AB|nr:YaaA family protein [Seramator thermalis]